MMRCLASSSAATVCWRVTAGKGPAKVVRTNHWKLNYYTGQGGELYDLENDPGEWDNLYDAPARQGIVRELKGALLDWLITADETTRSPCGGSFRGGEAGCRTSAAEAGVPRMTWFSAGLRRFPWGRRSQLRGL
jgi:hypothetical protein